MATKRQSKPRTVGQMLRDARVRKGEDGKPMPKTQAVVELGIGGRQTYYHWEDDYVVPSLEHAQMIAEFCEVPVEEVVNQILKAKGLRTYDEYLMQKSANRSATLRRKNTGSIPGLFKWGVRELAENPELLCLDAMTCGHGLGVERVRPVPVSKRLVGAQ